MKIMPKLLRMEEAIPDRRLESPKEIAFYLGRAVRGMPLWERRERLPVRRKMGPEAVSGATHW